jgi:flagellar biogenesis protein FliO
MVCFARFIAVCLLVAALISPVTAETTSGPPAWNDGGSVYLASRTSELAKDDSQKEQTPPAVIKPSAESLAAPPLNSRPQASPISPAALPSVDVSAERRLSPPHDRPSEFSPARDNNGNLGAMQRHLIDFGLPPKSIYTVASALTIVIGCFLLFVSILRRGGRKMRSRGALPADVVSVLGRVPIAARQFAELLRVGNKLVLVSLTPTGAEPITEVTDPVEVDRLLGLCHQTDRHSTTKAFNEMLRSFSNDSAHDELLADDGLPRSISPIAGAYRAHRGDRRRG